MCETPQRSFRISTGCLSPGSWTVSVCATTRDLGPYTNNAANRASVVIADFLIILILRRCDFLSRIQNLQYRIAHLLVKLRHAFVEYFVHISDQLTQLLRVIIDAQHLVGSRRRCVGVKAKRG